MNERELAKRLKTVTASPMPTELQQRIQGNVSDYIARRPVPRRHPWRTTLLIIGLVFALASSIGAVIAPYLALVAGLSIMMLGLPLLFWNTSLFPRLNVKAMQRVLVVMVLLGLTLSSSATVFAAAHMAEIYARLMQTIAKDESSTRHTELGFRLEHCPALGSSSRRTEQRYALSNRATLSPAEAEKVVQAQCIEQAAQKTAAEKWKGFRANDTSLQEGQTVQLYSFRSAAQITGLSPIMIKWNESTSQTFDTQPALIDINGQPADWSTLSLDSLVVPVLASPATIHISDSGNGRRSAIPRSVPGAQQTLVGLIRLPSEVDFKYYDPALRSQLVAIHQCEQNVQDDCIAVLSPTVILRQSVPEANARIQGRIVERGEIMLKIQSKPSHRQFTVELPAKAIKTHQAQLQAGTFVEVNYRASKQSSTAISSGDIAWVYVLQDVLKKHDKPQSF